MLIHWPPQWKLGDRNQPSGRQGICYILQRMNQNPSSLYERIGGEAMIAALIPAFYDRVLADAELAPFFSHAPLDKLHAMQREFFAMATGGPILYTGRPLAHVHQGLGIKGHHFAKFAGHLLDTLRALNTSEDDANDVIDHINVYVNEITGASY